MLERMTGIPVVGVVPHLTVDLDDEDSLTERFDRAGAQGAFGYRGHPAAAHLEFYRFQRPGAACRRSRSGMSSTRRSWAARTRSSCRGRKIRWRICSWLRQSGLEAAICKHAAGGGVVIGICGGYQMLCRSIADPAGVESGGSIRGMGLLAADTVFQGEKARTRVTGRMEHAAGIFRAFEWDGIFRV